MLAPVTPRRVNSCAAPVNAALAFLFAATARAADTWTDPAPSVIDGQARPSLAILLAGVAVLAFIFAKLEIQIEGPHGWAASLPTWRVDKHPLLDWFWGGRPMTGYHAWAFTFVGLAFHTPYLFGRTPDLPTEAAILGSLMLFWIVEDALWFALNPAFGLRRLNREAVWWHKQWIGPVPADYITFTLAAIALLTYSFWR